MKHSDRELRGGACLQGDESARSTGWLAGREDEVGDVVDIDHGDLLALDANNDRLAAG
jgi:hypothetical protein